MREVIFLWARKAVISSVSNQHSMSLGHNLPFSRKVLESNLCFIFTERAVCCVQGQCRVLFTKQQICCPCQGLDIMTPRNTAMK